MLKRLFGGHKFKGSVRRCKTCGRDTVHYQEPGDKRNLEICSECGSDPDGKLDELERKLRKGGR